MTTVDVGPALARHRAERGFLRCTPPLMTDQMARNLLAYKYAGEDKSYLYVHVLTPMNAWLIQFVPMWCAPNFMSLVGLFVIGSAYALTWLYSHDMKQAIPPWLCLYSGLACFAYQTIDNLDGRQARRTGSSSPLGLLFDHGVDALNVTLAALLLMTVFQLGNTGPIVQFLWWNTGFIPFVFATWEEFFTGKLTLGEFNGPSDGMFVLYCYCIAGFFFPGFYALSFGSVVPASLVALLPPAIAELPMGVMLIFAGWTAVVLTVFNNCWFVSEKVALFPRPLSKLVPFALMSLLGWSWVLADPSFFGAHARQFCFAMGFLFAQMICNMMIYHICDTDYHVHRPALIPLMLGWINVVGGPLFFPDLFPLISAEATLHLVLLANFAMWFYFIANAIREITALLDIRCFVITKKQEEAAAAAAAAAAGAASSAAVAPATNGAAATAGEEVAASAAASEKKPLRSSSRKKSTA